VCSLRRRFRALVAAHGWRAAAQRHFRGAAARLIAAAAAPRSGAGAGASAQEPPLSPSPSEWRSLYKLLTLVPWAIASPDLLHRVTRLRGCAPYVPSTRLLLGLLPRRGVVFL
jgi:hypothetical protein